MARFFFLKSLAMDFIIPRTRVSFRMNANRLSLLLLVSAAACYNTVPVGNTTPVVGKELVIQLTDAGSAQLSGALGQTTTEVRGLYVDSSPDTVRLGIIATTLANGEERLWNHEIVGIPRQYIARLGQKELSSGKTAGVAVLAVLAAAAVKIGFSGVTGSNGRNGGPPAGQ
jgi:hypothetical protein